MPVIPAAGNKMSVTKFGDLKLPQRKMLSELLDRTFVITGVKFESGRFGDQAVVTAVVDKHVEDYLTTSNVILEQLRSIPKDVLVHGIQVTMRKPSGKRYHVLE